MLSREICLDATPVGEDDEEEEDDDELEDDVVNKSHREPDCLPLELLQLRPKDEAGRSDDQTTAAVTANTSGGPVIMVINQLLLFCRVWSKKDPAMSKTSDPDVLPFENERVFVML